LKDKVGSLEEGFLVSSGAEDDSEGGADGDVSAGSAVPQADSSIKTTNNIAKFFFMIVTSNLIYVATLLPMEKGDWKLL